MENVSALSSCGSRRMALGPGFTKSRSARIYAALCFGTSWVERAMGGLRADGLTAPVRLVINELGPELESVASARCSKPGWCREPAPEFGMSASTAQRLAPSVLPLYLSIPHLTTPHLGGGQAFVDLKDIPVTHDSPRSLI